MRTRVRPGGEPVFPGGAWDRYFRAFDAETSEVLSRFRTNSGIAAAPSSYAIDGTQYIAVQAGWGVDAVRMEDSLNAALEETPHPPIDKKIYMPTGGVLRVFALDY